MRTFGKWLGRALLALLLAALAIGLWKREEITRLLAVNSLFDEAKIVSNFSNMDNLFLHTNIDTGNGAPTPLPAGTPMTLPAPASSWIRERNVTSLLVMQGGEVVFEDYFLGTTADDTRISWSMAKSYLSVLFGILVEEGAFASLDAPVTRYAPRLKGTAYDKATILNVLQMSSGIVFDEDYLDPKSDINRMGRILALGGTMDDFATGLTKTYIAPGEEWKYTSIDTHVLGMVARGATGRSLADLLGEKVISKLGHEGPAIYLTDGVGVAFALGGLNMTTRDYARFGAMVEQGGNWAGQQIVSPEWLNESTKPSARTKPGRTGYGYQWWIPSGSDEGQFMARGIYGQYIYIDRTRDAVVVVTSADRKFRDVGVSASNEDMLRKIAETAGGD